MFSLFATQCDIAGTLLYEAVGRSLDAGAIGGHEQDFGQRTYRRQPTRSDVARLGATVTVCSASEAKMLVAGLPGGPTDQAGVE